MRRRASRLSGTVTVPLSMELLDDMGEPHELDLRVTCRVGEPGLAYSDDRGSFGPVEQDLDVVAVEPSELTGLVREWLGARPGRTEQLLEDACRELADQDDAAYESYCESLAESRREARRDQSR